jgi:hypothetical protein
MMTKKGLPVLLLTIIAPSKITSQGVAESYCAKESRHGPRWDVVKFHYWASLSRQLSLFGFATTAHVDFNLSNPTNGLLVQCPAVMVGFSGNVDSVVIDPEKEWSCPSSDLFPQAQTSFKFDKGSNEMTIKQSWECEEEDGET